MDLHDIQKERPNVAFYKYYDSIFVVVKNEIYRVFLWLYEGGSQYVGDYLKTTLRGMKRLGAKEKTALQRGDHTSKFDIPFLYHLLQHTCGLAEDTSDIWNKPKTPAEGKSLEHTLYLLKEKRNALTHDPQPLMQMTQGELDTRLNELSQLCHIIIEEAGQKAKRSGSEVTNCVTNMEKALEGIKTKATPSGFSAGKFAVVAKQEMINKHPGLSVSSNTFVMPLINTKGKTGRYETHLKLFPLWQCEDGSLPTKTIIEGDTGTGKTSICRYIFDSWVSCNKEINDLQDYDLVLPVQCCKVSTRDLVEFLKEYLADTISFCGREETCEYLKSLRILWLIDGFEEASVDATELLKKIEAQGTTHLMVITTKSQQRQDLINILTLKDKVCEVSLSGLNHEGIRILIQNVFQQKEIDLKICNEKLRKFLGDVESLGGEILKELNTPLKSMLILKLWEEGKLNKESGASLSVLYKEIIEVRSKKLTKTLKAKFNLSEDNIAKVVDKQIELLYKIAFDMFMTKKFINIDKISQKKLEEGCESLFISADDWLSIFLQLDSKDKKGDSSYSFLHNTHQYYLAARHVCLLMERKSKPAEVLKRLFKQNISSQHRMNRNHFYLLLLQVVSNVAPQQTLDQPAAKVLIELLSMCNEFNTFEVVQYAAYSPIFVKEISKFCINEKWVVIDNTIKAAMALLEFVTPSGIKIDIYGDPKDIKSIFEFIDIISKRKLLIKFILRRHGLSNNNYSSDRYLEPICSSDAKCCLLMFAGNLTLNGCQYLLKMPNVRALSLNVSSNEVLGKIICNLKHHLCHLEVLHLNLMMPDISTPESFREFKVDDFDIHLPFMDESHVEETALTLSQLHQQYKAIHLYDITASHAVRLIQILDKRKVKVKSIVRHLRCDPYGIKGYITINYGPIPLMQTIPEFHDQWTNTYLMKSENELGVKQLIIVHKGILSNDIEFMEQTSESSFKVTRF